MAGRKRSAEMELRGRACKLIREAGEGSSVAEGRVMGSPLAWKGPGCHFYEASSLAASVFDWSSLTGALEDEGPFDPRHGAVEEEFVFVPQASWPVPISKRCLFTEITRWLRLQVHAIGVLVHDSGLQVAWVDVDVPPSEVGALRGREKFYSKECTLRVDAIESVCEHAVNWFVSKYCVQVIDLNYEKMKEFEGRAAYMETLVTVFNDKAVACKEKANVVKDRYSAVFSEADDVVKKYADVVPVGRAPSSRLEQLVCELAALIAKGNAIASSIPDVE